MISRLGEIQVQPRYDIKLSISKKHRSRKLPLAVV